jgi:S1-C subfamily serine protease/antitoxin component YwqK of YwqJK toxin-antitoxin module
MRKIIFILVAVCFCTEGFSQVIEYFNNDWKRVNNKNKAAYYRVINYGSNGLPTGIVRDYYITGELQWQGSILLIDKDGKDLYDGWCNWYYRNGQRSKLSFYKQGKLDSTTYYWSENGVLTKEEDYKNDRLHGAMIGYYPDGKLRYMAKYNNGAMEGNYYIEYDEAGKAMMTFTDYFADNHNNWTLLKGKEYQSEIHPNKLMLKTTGSWRIGSYLYLPLPSTAGFSLETVVHFEKGSTNTGHGIIWGFQDWNNYDYFFITADGYFQTGSYIKGIDVPSIALAYSRNINPGKAANKLRVLREGNEYWFMINGQLAGKTKYIDMAGKSAGAFVNGGIKSVYFDRFIVKYDANLTAGPTEKSEPNPGWLGNGSGILLDKNGLVATNYHVIQDAKVIEIEFSKAGKKYSFKAEVIKTDPGHDLALLRINDKQFDAFRPSALPYGIKATTSHTGSSIFALGYPMADILGDEIKFTDGKISATTGIKGDSLTYQISVPIQPGNSGGPLFDQEGNLIGITNARANMQTQNVSYAIKAVYLLKLVGGSYILPKNAIKTRTMEDKVNILSEFVPMIKIR